MKTKNYRSAERREAISEAILEIAEYTDKNALYIDTYVAANSVAMAMGVENIQDIEDNAEREAEIAVFRMNYKAAKQMILEESGIHQINNHLKLISKSKPSSPVIQRIKELEKNSV